MKRLKRSGFTLVEIMIVVAIIALLAAIAIPNVLRGRTTANEAASIGNLRALVSSLEMYRSVYQSYPNNTNWDAMYNTGTAPTFGPPSFDVNGDLNGDTIQGYNYTYAAAAAVSQTYTIVSNPQDLNRTGTRAFYVDESGTPHHCTGAGPATSGDPTIDQPPIAC